MDIAFSWTHPNGSTTACLTGTVFSSFRSVTKLSPDPYGNRLGPGSDTLVAPSSVQLLPVAKQCNQARSGKANARDGHSSRSKCLAGATSKSGQDRGQEKRYWVVGVEGVRPAGPGVVSRRRQEHRHTHSDRHMLCHSDPCTHPTEAGAQI